jgi:peroxiredoxin
MRKAFYSIIIIISISSFLHAQSIGSKAPDFTAKDLQGNTVKLSDLKGKVVLLDFWASWCEPCKKSMPHLIELYNEYKDTSFTIIGVNVDTDMKKLEEFEGDLSTDIPFTVIFDKKSEIPPLYEVEGMPTTVIINKEGIIKYKEVGYTTELKDKLDKTITELITK